MLCDWPVSYLLANVLLQRPALAEKMVTALSGLAQLLPEIACPDLTGCFVDFEVPEEMRFECWTTFGNRSTSRWKTAGRRDHERPACVTCQGNCCPAWPVCLSVERQLHEQHTSDSMMVFICKLNPSFYNHHPKQNFLSCRIPFPALFSLGFLWARRDHTPDPHRAVPSKA